MDQIRDDATPWLYLTPYVGCLALVGALLFWIGTRRSRTAAAHAFLFWLAVQATLIVAFIGELRAPDLSSKLFWDNVQWLLLPLLVAAGTLFAFRYAGSKAGVTRLATWLSGGVAAICVVSLLIAQFSSSARATARIQYSGRVPTLLYDWSAFDHAVALASYVSLLACVARLWSSSRGQTRRHRGRTWIAIFALLLPTLLSSLAYTGLHPFGQRDVSPIAFTLGAALIFWGVVRHELFDILPIARVAVLEVIPDAVLVLDDLARVVDANAAAQRLLDGRALEGTHASELIPALRELSSMDIGSHERRISHAQRQLVVRVVPLASEANRSLGCAVVLRDVTDVERLNSELEARVRERTAEVLSAKERLEQSEAMLRAVFDGTNTLIGLLDAEGKLLAANRVALELSGTTPESVIGRPFADTAWWSHDQVARNTVQRAIERARVGEMVRFETTHRAADGDLRTIDFLLTPFRDPSGEVVWLIPEGRDVTDLKLAERRQAELTRKLGHAERLESLGRMATGVAHDFNNLLVVVSGNVELLLMQLERDPAAQELLQELRVAVESASALTRQLLLFGRKPSGDLEPLQVDARLRGLATMLRRLTSSGTQLQIDCAAGEAEVQIENGQYEQIVVNLLMNAQQALGDRGNIAIRTCVRYFSEAPPAAVSPLPAQGRYLVTSVSDDGSGMPPEVIEHVFEPFFTTKQTGTGLGLATVYAIATRARGLICLRSGAGVGTVVEVLLPVFEKLAESRATHARL